MAFKQFALDERTQVTIYKRKSSRSLRLSIAADGTVKVSIPTWTPYRAGLEFARSRRSWIEEQRHEPKHLVSGQPVGKAHRLIFLQKSSISRPGGRVKGSEIIVSYPPGMVPADAAVQKAALATAIKALRQQAENLLPQRLATLASKYDFSYKEVSVKQLKGRWGSCDQHGNITLNLYLMQLPWDLIDYVLLHELTHTQVLHHGPDFWDRMTDVSPDAKGLRKRIRDHQPVLR
jgi:predicted metal-dependent hydrolase